MPTGLPQEEVQIENGSVKNGADSHGEEQRATDGVSSNKKRIGDYPHALWTVVVARRMQDSSPWQILSTGRWWE